MGGPHHRHPHLGRRVLHRGRSELRRHHGARRVRVGGLRLCVRPGHPALALLAPPDILRRDRGRVRWLRGRCRVVCVPVLEHRPV